MVAIAMEQSEKISLEEGIEVEALGEGHFGIKVKIGHIYWCPSTRQILLHAHDNLEIFDEHKITKIA